MKLKDKITLSKKSRSKRVCVVSYISCPGTGKLSRSDKNQTSSRPWELEINWKEKLLGELGASENVHYLVLDDGYLRT